MAPHKRTRKPDPFIAIQRLTDQNAVNASQNLALHVQVSVNAHASKRANEFRQMNSQLQMYTLYGGTSIHSALSQASQDFSAVTAKADPGGGLADILLAALFIAAPELLGLKKLMEHNFLKSQTHQLTGSSLFGAGKDLMNFFATQNNESRSASARMSISRSLAAQVDKLVTVGIERVMTITALIDTFQSNPTSQNEAAVLHQLTAVLPPSSMNLQLAPNSFRTDLYTDMLLFDMLNEYTKKHVTVQWIEILGGVQFYRLTGNALNPDINDPNLKAVEVIGMDNRQLAYDNLGAKSPNSAELRKSGRPAVDSFRDIVKVWGARFQRATSATENLFSMKPTIERLL